MESVAKEKRKRRPWGEKRIPFLQHVAAQCRALGIRKFNRERCLEVIKSQALREPESFLAEERHFHKDYLHTISLTPRGLKMILTQLGKVWGVKPKVVRKRKVPPKPPAPKKTPPPPPSNARSPKAPPPPPNAVSPRKAPPPSPPPPMGEQLEEIWEDVFGETIPPLPEGMGQSVGTTYGAEKGRKFKAHGHDKKVCISIKFSLPEHQALIVAAVQKVFDDLEPFGAVLMNTKHSRRSDGLWADLLIHYSIGVVDLYKVVLSCDLVLDAEASSAARFGETAQDAEALGI